MTPSPALILLTHALINAIDLASQPRSKAPEYRPATRDAVKFARAAFREVQAIDARDQIRELMRQAAERPRETVDTFTYTNRFVPGWPR